MRQIYLVKGPVVDFDVYRKTHIFHAVKGIMLQTGDDILFLDTPGQCQPHLPLQVGVLAVAFLSPSPGRVSQQVDADAPEVVAATRPDLGTNHLADPVFQLPVKAGRPGHGNRKTGRLVHDNPSRSVGEFHTGDLQSFNPAGAPGGWVVHSIHFGHGCQLL